MKLSAAQQKIVDRMRNGESLRFNQQTGRYVLQNGFGVEKDIDQRPVLVMIRDGAIQQDVMGHCRVA